MIFAIIEIRQGCISVRYLRASTTFGVSESRHRYFFYNDAMNICIRYEQTECKLLLRYPCGIFTRRHGFCYL